MASVEADVETAQENGGDRFDGITKVILHWVKLILVILFYPVVWLFREFARTFRFLSGGSEGKDRPLDHEEIAFVESIPIFLPLFAITIATILGLIAWVGYSDRIKDFFSNLTRGLDGIIQIFSDIWGGIWGVISAIGGFFVDGIMAIVDFIANVKLDPTIVFGLVIVVIIVLFLAWVFISEMALISKLMRKLGYVGLGITDLPRVVYFQLDKIWLRILKSFGRAIAGGEGIITHRSRGFYQRILQMVILYSIWTFGWGILLLAVKLVDPSQTEYVDNTSAVLDQVLYLLVVLLISGVVSGTLLVWVLAKVLANRVKDKYNPDDKSIDLVRHQSLLKYLSTKPDFPTLELTTLSLILDIEEDDFKRHLKDSNLKRWVIYDNYLVNEQLFDQRLDQIDEMVDEGLENEDVKPLVKAVDLVAFTQKGFGMVAELAEELQEKKEIIYEDIADLRGELGLRPVQPAAPVENHEEVDV